MKTYINTTDLTIPSLYNEYIKKFTVFMIETVSDDICLAYKENKINLRTHDFNRTILVVDYNPDFELISKTIHENIELIHTVVNEREKITDIFHHHHIELFIQTSQYWDDVRYFTRDKRTYLAAEAFEYDLLQTKIMELVKNKFYDRDFLADVCLEENPNKFKINTAINIIKNQKVEFKLIEPLLMNNQDIKNSYEKIILKDTLSRDLPNQNLVIKKSKL